MWQLTLDISYLSGTFAESSTGGCCGLARITGEDSLFAAYGSVFRDNTAKLSGGAFNFAGKASHSLTDCLVIGNVGSTGGAMDASTGASVSILRTTFDNNRATAIGGCFMVGADGSVAIYESDILNSWAEEEAGMASIGSVQ